MQLTEWLPNLNLKCLLRNCNFEGVYMKILDFSCVDMNKWFCGTCVCVCVCHMLAVMGECEIGIYINYRYPTILLHLQTKCL